MNYLYDCAAEFTEELPEQVKYEYADSTYHTKTTKGGSYCCFCFGTNHISSSVLERHNMQTEIIPQIGNDRFAIVKHCTDCEYTSTTYVAAKSVIADYYGVVDGQPHTVTISDLSEAGVYRFSEWLTVSRSLQGFMGLRLQYLLITTLMLSFPKENLSTRRIIVNIFDLPLFRFSTFNVEILTLRL